MLPGSVPLNAGAASRFVSSDGRLTVDVPAGAISPQQVALDGGSTALLVRQILPESGSNAGGSGQFSFGAYVIQVTRAGGALASHGLQLPVTLTLNTGNADSALDLAHAFVSLNASVPPCVNLDPTSVVIPPHPTTTSPTPNSISIASGARSSTPTTSAALRASVGHFSTQRAGLTPQGGSLTTSAPLASPTTSVSFGTDSPVATFGKPQPFEVDLSGASLTSAYTIQLPPGPKGFKPDLSLIYNSAGVSDQHNPQGAAGWVGEGWNLSLGSISWAEHFVNETGGTAHWQDSWELSDAYGTSATLIPPATNTATYNEDSGNPITPSPVQWHTAPETYAKIYSFQSPNPPSALTLTPPCFRVFLRNGIMEEFGCTPDSVQFYPEPSGANAGKPYISSWLLDLITEPDGNQIHVNYQQDLEPIQNLGGDVRDEVPYTVEWDSPTCVSATSACSTSGAPPNQWSPLMRVSFQAAHTVLRSPPGSSNCGAGLGTLRCDDPADLSGSGGLAAPMVQNEFVLNDVLVQVKDGSGSTWNTLRDYQFGYDQSAAPAAITDPLSGQAESTAGKLNLTQLAVVGDDGSTALPVTNFTYTRQVEYYEDSLNYPTPTTNCGPSWNTGYTPNPNHHCVLWSQSYDGNSYYLSTVSNGLGLAQSFAWSNLRDNMHGVYNGGDPTDPFYCTNQENGGGGATYPCDMVDDETWSRIGLSQQTNSLVRLSQAGQGGTQTSTPVNGISTYTYKDTYPLQAQECPDCVAGYSWGNQDDNDYQDFYNGKFMGFTQASVGNPDGSSETHKFYSTEGWGVWSTSQVTITCPASPPDVCHNDPYWDFTNAAHGHEFELDRYSGSGVLLNQVLTQLAVVCTPPWIASGSPPVTNYGNWNGNLVSALDLANPVAPCDVQYSYVDDKSYDGATGTVPDRTTTYTYESGTRPCATCFGRVTKVAVASNDGGANGSPTNIVKAAAYIWNDAITTTATSASGSYLISFPAINDTEDSSGANRYQCTYTEYDGQTNNITGQSSTLTRGDATKVSRYTGCGTAPSFTPTGAITTTFGFDNGSGPYGNPWWSNDADANAGSSSHLGCTVNAMTHSNCTTFDSYFAALATQQANALNQTTSTSFQAPSSATASGGFGLWPLTTSDVNGKATTYTYDGLGRQTSMTLPSESTGLTTRSMAYTVWCSGSAAQSPCAEIDNTQRLNDTTTITYRAFYDGMGHLAETRSPGPGNKNVVQYYYYDVAQRLAFKSIPYFVTGYTGAPGSAAYSIPDSTVAGTTYVYDGLGRTVNTTDALSETTYVGYAVVCNAAGTGDSACYEQVLTADPLNHQSGQLMDAMGRINYEQRYTGNSVATYAVYATTKYTYDYLGELTQVLHPDGVTKTNFLYDMAGRQTGLTDADRGKECYVYDQDSNLVQSTDARSWNSSCSVGSVFVGYDGLDRQIWRNTTNSPSGAYDTYTYDSTANGNVGKGRLTSETFAGGGMSGSYAYVYDSRGQQTSITLTVGSTNYPLSGMTYNDAGSPLFQTYPDGEVVKDTYGSDAGWLTKVTSTTGSTTTTLASLISYDHVGGAYGQITSANLAGLSPSNVYAFSSTFDLLGRSTDIRILKVSGNAVVFEQTRSFDASGNVSTANTTLAAGTDKQAFCYDEQNRLTAAAASGTLPCQTFTPGSLTSAFYNQSFAYDNLGRLTSGPLGAYSYGNSAHVHAATAIGSTYTAAYDAAGDMTCRAPSSVTTCAGTQTGAQLTFNNEGQLSNWQNQPTNPTTTAAFLYDGQGSRVAQQVTSGGTTTTTVYVGGVEEDATTGGTTTKTTYYYANGSRFAMAVNGVFKFLASDGLGSANVTLDAAGNTIAALLYAPYGTVRYASGTMPTDYGFTGQHSDSTSGLDYYGARYYDPLAGQFAAGDSVLPGSGFDIWGLSRYAYVEGNPIVRTDPTGHANVAEEEGGCDPQSCAPITSSSRGSSPGIWQWVQNVGQAVGQVFSIRPTEAQDNLIGIGQSLHGSQRDVFVGALSTARDWTGGETADLQSGDPYRIARGTVGAVVFASNFVPAGSAANLGRDAAEIAVEEGVSHAPEALSPAARAFLNSGEADTYVYNGVRDGENVYVGITKNIANRQAQHGDRFVLDPITNSPLTRGQARAIEQAQIVDNPAFENIRNSISPSHPYYDEALAWGRQWLQDNL